ncbi:MAG: hypothetical protein ABI700_17485 [Chloroflexota bacterium]
MIVKDLYLEITNISQGVNIAIFVYIFTTSDFLASIPASNYGTMLIALASFLGVIIFWVRYYLDTAILDRSFTTLSVTWFFLYVVTQGISISFIGNPSRWFLATSIFLFFGAGFYSLNLMEIRRKLNAGVMASVPRFIGWQKRRLIELLIFSVLSLCCSIFVNNSPALTLPTAIIAVAFAFWQIVVTEHYRTFKFIETGV